MDGLRVYTYDLVQRPGVKNNLENLRGSVRIILKCKSKGKAVTSQVRRGPEGSRKLRFPDFVTTAQNGGRLSDGRTGRLYPQEILLVLFLLEAKSTPGP